METQLLKVLRQRRSIRQFTSQRIESDKVDALTEAAVRAPTSRGINPWEFIVVSNSEMLGQLAKAKAHGSAFIDGAQIAIVFAADTTKSDVWTEDCSISAITVQLVAEELGLGSCWAQIRLRPHNENISAGDYVKNLLGLPASHEVECIIAFGYPAEGKVGHTKDSLPFGQVHQEHYRKM